MEAVDDSGLTSNGFDPSRIGVLLGACTADLLRTERYLETMVSRGITHSRPSDVWNHFPSTPVDIIASHFGFEGLRSCIVTACASSTMAIGSAADAVRDGRLDAAIAGGTDAMSRLTFSGFNAIRVMDPQACRPFDRARAGMNLGEGAAMLVLEDLDGARRRGATIYAEVAGHSLTCEAFHPTSPEPDGRAIGDAIRRALADGSVNADEVDHVNAHGTATPHNDRAEARGIRLVFGERAGRLPVTSVKSMIGHCLGAAGGLETAITALTIARGVIPPTLHHTETDPECEVDVVANEAREAPVRCAVSTSLAFGGNDHPYLIDYCGRCEETCSVRFFRLNAEIRGLLARSCGSRLAAVHRFRAGPAAARTRSRASSGRSPCVDDASACRVDANRSSAAKLDSSRARSAASSSIGPPRSACRRRATREQPRWWLPAP